MRLAGLALLGLGATSNASAAAVAATFSSAASVPVSSSGYLASGNTVDLTLGFTPTPGTTLTVVNNTGLGFINGTFDNLANGATVTLSHGGTDYDFVAWYYGGNGNDLVLLWPQASLAGWGRASNGRLAVDQAGNVLVPTDADLSGPLAGKTIVQVSRGLSHTLAMTSEGKVYAWGNNTNGQLGTNSSFGGFAPVAVFTDNGPTALNGKFVIAIATTRHTSYALSSDGSIASWGENQRGQLGNGTDGNGSNSADSRVPVAVTLSGVLSGKTVVSLAGGTHHILALCSDGTVAAWGNGGSGQLGDNSTNDRSTPVLVNTASGTSALFGKTVVAIAGGGNHSLALCSDGTVVAWGSNSNGQLGDNSTSSRNAPAAVNTTSGTSALFGKTVTAIAAGNQHSIALNSDGTVATWGRNNRNQLGDNSITDSSVPVAMNTTSGVSALFGKSVQAIAAGLDGNLALTTDGALAAWGYNQLGQVGDGVISATRAVPTAVSVENGVSVLSGKAIISLADSGSASDHFMALYATLPEVIPEQMIAHESNRNWRGVASSADGVKLVAVPNGGYLYTSTDSGVTWLEHTSLGQKNWYAVASSNNGSKLVAVADGSRIFTSTDSGANWTEQFGSSGKQWRTVASSADGTKLIAAANQDRIYTSTDSGITWTVRFNNGNWNGVASSADGTKLVAVASSGNIATSNDSGVTWTARMTDQNRNWYGVASSADGTKLVACIYGGQLYTSTDSGVNWTARDSSRDWQSVASSADGTHLIASVRNDGLIYVSTDSGVTWSSVDSARNWWGVGISADGAKLFASVYGGQLYTLGSAPEIAVEQPALTDLSSGSTTDFGSVLTGDTADLTFTIRNPGNLTLTGLDTTIDGTDAGLFTLTASPTGPLDPSDTTTFTVRFAPLSNGLKSATLHIASNDSDENPFNIVLNGTGAGPAPEIAVEQPALTDLMTGAMTDFGSAAANSTTDLTFTIRNTGTADLTGVDVTVDGTDSALFTVTATPDSVITPMGSTTFTVRFAPVSTGLKSATLHIASNDGDENPFDLSLTGTGTPEQMIARNSSSSWRGVASSADGVKLVAAITGGHIHTSTDSGATWTARPLDTGPKNWYAVASSADGTKLVAVADGARIHTSIDSGLTWTEQFNTSGKPWRTVASSADGTKLIAGANQDRLYTSTDSGATWTGRYNNGNWNGVASSADGTKLVAVENSGNVFASTDSGASWTARMTDQSRNWFSVASSADGTKLVASVYDGQLYTSTDSGATWAARDSRRLWRSVASSADGTHLIASERDGLIYVSTDSGVNWTTLDSTRDWYGVAISADGAKLLASVYNGQLYTLGSAPEIAVEQPALSDLSSGGTTDFGSVLTGDTADLTFTIRNPGTETLTGLSITIDGTDSALFTLTASPTGPLDPSDTTTFAVRFAPLSIGMKSAALHIASNDGDENPFNIVLSGTGTVPAPEIVVEQPESTDLMTGAMQDFGSVAANSTTDLTFTIRNTGTADLTGVDVTVDGTDSTLFTVTATPDSVISPAGSTTFTVRFAPVSAGLKSASLHIASNDLDENPFNLSLTGTGTPEQMIAQGISQSWRGVTSSADGVKMAAVANNGYLHTSTDSGLTWTSLTALGQKSWYDVASSNDGSKLVAVADGKRIFTSIDSGSNWTEQFGSNSNVQWRTVASSADGTKLIAAANQDRIYTSTDSGITWTVRFNNGNWHGVASSADGTKLVAVENSGNIFTSTDSGANWTARMTDQSRNWFSVASSADGTKLVASVYGGQLYTSIDSGITWTARESSRNWRLVASSFDGSQLIAAERDGLIYVSSDSGVNWTTLDSARDWYGVAISADGAKLLASVFGGQLYTLGTASDVSQSGPDFVVTTLDDHNDGVPGIANTTLREAINAANANPDLSIISFDPMVFGTAQIIQLQSALPALTGNVEIQGTLAGLTVRRDAPGNFRIFSVNSGATAKLRNLTITNGSPTNGGGGVQNHGVLTVENCIIHDNIADGEGGGIESFGTLTVINSTIHGNAAGWGGGIESWSDVTVTDSIIRDNTVTYGGGGVDIGEGSATLSGSTISGNSAPVGGGIRHVGSGLLAITNSTISGNLATGSATNDGGGAIHLNAGYGGGGPGASLDSVTLTANTAPNQSGGGRQGLWAAAGDLTLRNTIIVGNGTQDLEHDGGTLLSLGHNLIGTSNAAISFTATGDQGAITDAGLEPLADNGGPTPTHALTLTSPALNSGATSLLVDQRGEERPSGDAVDIGAFELYLAPAETASVLLGNLSATYDGGPHAVSVLTLPSGLTTKVTYDGSTTAPTNAGSYAVVATVTGTTHHGSATGTLVIAKAPSNVLWSTPLPVTYGTALSSTQLNATANVPGVFTYAPLAGTVLDAGLQPLGVTFVPTDTTNYLGSTGSQNLLVNQATATVSLSELTPTYDGSPKSVGVDTTPSGLSTSVTYDGGSTAPSDAGTYAVVATISDANYVGTVSGSLVIAKAPSTVTWTTPAAITYGTALGATQLNATANTAGSFVYDPAAGTILDARDHSLSVTFTPTDITNRLGDTAAQSITVNPATVAITLGGLAAIYDGNPHAVTVTTDPADVPVNVTYASSATAPTDAGSYAVEATPVSSNTTGSASATLVIAKADPVITWTPGGTYIDGDLLDAAALNATADTAGTFTYTPAAGTSLAEGSISLSVEFVPDDATNYTTVTAQRSITVFGSGLAITTQPSDQTVIIGSPATFTVVAAGNGTITYQWRKNGVEISGATNATYTIETTTLSDTDSYDAVVNNGAENATSDTASLTVINVVVSHEVVGTGYTAGGTVTISSTVTYNSAITSIGWSVLPPDPVDDQKWTFQIAGGEIAQVSPFTGDTDLFDFAWTRLPTSPFTFTYTLNVPANSTGQKSLVALVKPRFNGMQLQALVPPDPLILEDAPPYHSADINQDFALNLTELLRVIELYNTRFGTNRTGRYNVSAGTEDGFAAEPTIGLSEVVTLTRYHSGDYDQDGKLNLTELLRIIELYNYRVGTQRTGQYHPHAGTDDGFAAGPGD